MFGLRLVGAIFFFLFYIHLSKWSRYKPLVIIMSLPYLNISRFCLHREFHLCSYCPCLITVHPSSCSHDGIIPSPIPLSPLCIQNGSDGGRSAVRIFPPSIPEGDATTSELSSGPGKRRRLTEVCFYFMKEEKPWKFVSVLCLFRKEGK